MRGLSCRAQFIVRDINWDMVSIYLINKHNAIYRPELSMAILSKSTFSAWPRAIFCFNVSTINPLSYPSARNRKFTIITDVFKS